AAEAGSRNGAFNLGLLLAREGSEPEAVVWWTRAANDGHGRAALRLALVCARRGDLDEGQRWATRAAELGPAEVTERAGRLRDALREELSA
ncbi:sel1 repeat family protein, partial [Streptomyces sp. SID69]|nr:sel1 repeat family protein [Streptomyces sp. SID69]